jgi:hypothetical protein
MKRNSKKQGLFWMFVFIFCLIFSMSVPAQRARHAGQRMHRLATAENSGSVVQKAKSDLDARTGASADASPLIAPVTEYDILATPEYTKLVRPPSQHPYPEFTYSFTYPIPPSYSVYYPHYIYGYGQQHYSIPRSYQLPPLFLIRDVEAYNRAKLAEIEAREQYEQRTQEYVADIPSSSQEISREEQSIQLIVPPVIVEEKPPTILKMKTEEMEAEAFGLSAEQFQQLLSVVESQKTQETAFQQNVIRLLFEFLGVIVGTILLGYTIKWAMQKA